MRESQDICNVTRQNILMEGCKTKKLGVLYAITASVIILILQNYLVSTNLDLLGEGEDALPFPFLLTSFVCPNA